MAKRWLVYLTLGLTAIVLTTLLLGVFAVLLTYPKLPSLESLTDYRPKLPLRVYTQDNVLIGEFGEERRSFVKIGTVPILMKQAILAAEDERFYQHGGIDYMGVVRAMMSNVVSGEKRSGASTITMQVAKNFFLSSEKTFTRKFNEALLSFKIEHNLSKDQILELYFNQIFLGQRAYGFGSAAQIYFGKSLDQLSIAEMAMLAGLPKAPSLYNPVVNPKRAKLRQLYVLRRMAELRFITPEQYAAAKDEELLVLKSLQGYAVHGEYVAEMVRQWMVEKYKEAAYTQGFKVYTTLDSQHQAAAYDAVRRGLLDYDRRHGYRGPEAFADLSQYQAGNEAQLDDLLAEVKDADDIQAAIVLEASPSLVQAYVKGGRNVRIEGAGLRFAARMLSAKVNPSVRIKRGAVIRVRQLSKGWEIVQVPQVEAAFVALDPVNGSIKALVGGFDFNRNNFNHVTQAWRQPGSSFKPFIYSAGIDRGFTPATMINDAPLVLPASVAGQRWEPKNYDGSFSGMMSMRSALTRSKNLVSIRILQAITPEFAQEYITRFGFSGKEHPPYLTMALGAGMVTPLQVAEGYAVFANTGFKVEPYFIDRIENVKGAVLARTQPDIAGQNAPRTLDERNAFIMTSMMGDVVKFGTAAKAMSLGRRDLAGKTGTTSDSHDAWFAGFQPNLVAVAWVGFDQPRSLGSSETGGGVALPIWIGYMAKALKGVPEVLRSPPDGVVESNGEYFLQEFTRTNPDLNLDNSGASIPEQEQPTDEIKDLLF
jgi:penicillin-binding protein 1A